MIKYILYFGFVIADIVFYILLRDLDFAERNKEVFLVLTMANEPIYFGCIMLSFLSLRKANYRIANVTAFLPLIVTFFYYYLFK